MNVKKMMVKGFGILIVGALLLTAMPTGIVKAAFNEYWVAADGDCGGNSPCTTSVQVAIDAVADGGTVYVEAGTYTVPSSTSLFQLSDGKKLLGEGADVTTLQGDGTREVISISSDSMLDGFTITGGVGHSGNGGGMSINSGTPTISNCYFTGNSASNSGGAIYVSNASPFIENCIFENNSAGNSGGAVFFFPGAGTLRFNAFLGNTATFGEELYSQYPAGGVDARYNWWGNESGPTVGIRDQINSAANVLYEPYCTDISCDYPVANVTQGTYFTTIQAAIDAASDGDAIEVKEGTYTENLYITKDLSLLGAGAGSTVIQSPDTLPVCLTTSNENKAIVCIEDSVVTLDGFTIDGLGKGNANYRFVGVGFHNAGGTLQNSEVLNIKDTPFSGSQHGIAIYSYNENGTEYTINVLNNTITDFQKNAIALNASDTTLLNVLVSGNTVIGSGPTSVTAQNGIQVWAMLGSGVISDNTVSGIYYTDLDGCDWVATSILNYYADVDIRDNTITEAQEAIYPYLGTGDITGNTISITRQDACYCDAIYIYHPTASDIEVSNNVLTYDANGLTGYDSYAVAVSVGDEDITFTAQGNQINNYDIGIDLYNESSAAGDITSISIQNNALATALIDIWVEGELQAAPLIIGNKLLGDAVGLQNDLSFQVSASPNWWGSIAGPASGQVVGDVDYTPWCGDDVCSFTVPDENGVIELSGNINIPGGIVVDVPGLTFLLKDGTIIENNSPCFVINADNTTITTESLGGALCIPTNGSNGIDVADGLTNIIIEGLEIDGSEQDTGDGINFAGAITDVILRDNFIHDLDDDGVEFTSAPAGTVQVQGNLFMDNAGFGLNAPADLDVTYNAWGGFAGAESGVDLPVGVTSSDPWTHVDLYMESSGTDVEDEVREGETITYMIYANLQNATGADFEISFDASLLEVASTALGSVFTAPATGSDVVTYDNAAGEIHFAGVPEPFEAKSGEDLMLFSVTFTAIAAGDSDLSFSDDSFAMSPAGGPSNNIYAAELDDGAVTIRDHYTVTGTVSMQGRTVRSGVLFTLTSNTGILWGPFQASSSVPISNNVFLANVVENEYQITISQDRYLDVTVASGKFVDVISDLTLAAIELLGGDVNNSNAIGIDDAGIVGADYGLSGIENDGDANFDSIVNIQDLALVGGNFDATSADAYDSWTP